MKAGIIGAGYVGLVTAACFASRGLDIMVHDTSKEKIATLNAGGLPIFEPGLEKLLTGHTISFTNCVKELVETCRYIFLCVGTPQGADGEADLSYLQSAVEAICHYTEADKYIIIKSTVPPGTARRMEELSRSLNKNCKLTFISNPEFLRQGSAVHDFLYPDRIIVGSDKPLSGEEVLSLYEKWDCPKLLMSRESAELAKYAANSFLAMKISYSNMIASLADRAGASIDDIQAAIGSDSRIGKDFLKAGAGFGGSCFPKDLNAMLHIGRKHGTELPLIENTLALNENQPAAVVSKIKAALKELTDKRIAILGLSFKPMTDDVRCSPAVSVAEHLLNEGAKVILYDPLVRHNPVHRAAKGASLKESLKQSDAAVIMTDWPEFRQLLQPDMLNTLKRKIIIDGRNMFRIEEIEMLSKEVSMYYASIGRPLHDSLTAKSV
ncbi:UDP-glucose dehydrogenase family protein [Fictibacillus iocasae]|uniref:UDP-glucose 6-dehydrogenase n=1 Tax=Fictibacillus iocasae TaxID=2715437 RepID=A0ABW2NRV2_9BACL